MKSLPSPLHAVGLLSAILLTLTTGVAQSQTKVATLHPGLTDLAQQVGGDKITVVPIMRPGADPHEFSPKPDDVKLLEGVPLILASGKSLENYLGKLRDNLKPSQVILEVGKTIPELTEKETSAILLEPEDDHDHDHEKEAVQAHEHHHHNGADPHWWNSIDNMKRAAGIVASALAKVDSANSAIFRANAKAYSLRLDELKKWAKKELSVIPQAKRKLATAHLSLTYFAYEFGFKLIAVQGLSPETKATSKDIADAIKKIREHQVPAIFPEQGVNAKQIEEIIRETGTKKGGELIADGNGAGELAHFEAAVRHNIETLVAALK